MLTAESSRTDRICIYQKKHGKCHQANKGCPHSHDVADPNVPVCHWWLMGICKEGQPGSRWTCPMRHVSLPTDTGCSIGSNCTAHALCSFCWLPGHGDAPYRMGQLVCPVLAENVCQNCGIKGHTRSHCKKDVCSIVVAESSHEYNVPVESFPREAESPKPECDKQAVANSQFVAEVEAVEETPATESMQKNKENTRPSSNVGCSGCGNTMKCIDSCVVQGCKIPDYVKAWMDEPQGARGEHGLRLAEKVDVNSTKEVDTFVYEGSTPWDVDGDDELFGDEDLPDFLKLSVSSKDDTDEARSDAIKLQKDLQTVCQKNSINF